MIREAVPGGGILLEAVNAALPPDRQLPAHASGRDVESAISALPGPQQANLLDRQFDVQETQIRASADTLRAMLDAERASPHTTRPFIAKWSFIVAAAISVVFVTVWGYAVLTKAESLVSAVTNGWPMILAVVGPMWSLLYAYFGVLRKEQGDRLSAASGQPMHGIIASVIKGLRK